ncbi:MAG: class I SAM-dependent RNA methyltransferase, partial [Anaerolineae bacterium]|nr:class I SAM-dependent RNA methyltransferase [Anaerolineae bacterium]
RCSPGSFFQVNLPQAAALVHVAIDRLALTPTERVLDLYAGVGLFTAFIAPRVQHVDAVELFAPAVADARHNLYDYTNINFHIGKIESILPRLTHPIDSALVDPPRAGMDAPALNALIHLNPRQIVYVSCDPATLARDARRLREAGYHLRDVQPVDMFPQTYHIESVAHFLRPQG